MARPADPSVRTALIEAAARHVADGGVDALSLRRVATDVGTSTQAVYTHFGSKDDLVRAVVEEAFHRLDADMRAVPVTDDPLHDLVGVAKAYRHNALTNAHLYRVMFEVNPLALTSPAAHVDGARVDGARLDGTGADAADHTAPPAQSEIGLHAFAAMVERVAHCVEAGLLSGEPARLALQVWATAHGVVSLEIAGFLGDDGAATFDGATSATFRGLVRGSRP